MNKISLQNKIKTILIVVAALLIFVTPVRRGVLYIMSFGANFLFPERARLEESRLVSALEARVLDLQKENKFLKRQFGLENKTIPANVSLGHGYLFSDVFLINVGTEVGISKGDLVVSEFGIVGRIFEAGSGWSKVTLLSKVGSEVVLRAGIHKDVVFSAVGVGGGEIKAELPQSVEISVGDIVWLGENPMLIAGLVDTIDKAGGRQLQRVIIKSLISLRSLTDVVVIPNL